MTRLSIPHYAMALAHVASLRSEDPYRKVGAVALSHDHRILGAAYNGLAPGFNAPAGFWEDRDKRQKFMLHAEVNLMSLVKRMEVKIVAVTTCPCTSCMLMLCAYGVKEIYYADEYTSHAHEIADLYGIRLARVDQDESLITMTNEAKQLTTPLSEIDQMKLPLPPPLPLRGLAGPMQEYVPPDAGPMAEYDEPDPKIAALMKMSPKKFCPECGMIMNGSTCVECQISPAQ